MVAKWAWLNADGSVRDVITTDPATSLFPAVAANYVPCADTVTAPQAPTIKYRLLSFVDFITLAMSQGGLTTAAYAAAQSNANLMIYIDLLKEAGAKGGIAHDAPFVQQGAAAFVAAGTITQAGSNAIFANWPTN